MSKLVCSFVTIICLGDFAEAGNWLAKLEFHRASPSLKRTETCNAVWLSKSVLITPRKCAHEPSIIDRVEILTGDGTYLTTVSKSNFIYPPNDVDLQNRIRIAKKKVRDLKENIEAVKKAGLTVVYDNQNELAMEIIYKMETCIEADFLLINTHQFVDDKLPYEWNQETIKINTNYTIKTSIGESLESIDCKLIHEDFTTNKTSVRLNQWERQHKLFINDKFVCIAPENVTYVNKPFISNGELLGFLTMHSTTEEPRITLLLNQNEWIKNQLVESETITRTGWYHYGRFSNVMLILVFISALILGGYRFKLTFNKEVCDVELQKIREVNCKKTCFENGSMESLPPIAESK